VTGEDHKMDENEDDDESEFFEPGFNTKMVDEEKK